MAHALRADLPKTAVAKEIVHDRYKDLARVEWAFRDSKTVQLERRPVCLRDEDRTRGHALVVMLASLCLIEVVIGGRPSYSQVPTPRDDVRRLFEAAAVAIPTGSPSPRPAQPQGRKTPTTTKRVIGSTRYRAPAQIEMGEHPLQRAPPARIEGARRNRKGGMGAQDAAAAALRL